MSNVSSKHLIVSVLFVILVAGVAVYVRTLPRSESGHSPSGTKIGLNGELTRELAAQLIQNWLQGKRSSPHTENIFWNEGGVSGLLKRAY
jgi:hypothetical protein